MEQKALSPQGCVLGRAEPRQQSIAARHLAVTSRSPSPPSSQLDL